VPNPAYEADHILQGPSARKKEIGDDMVKILLALLPRKYRAVFNAGLSLFSAVDTWDEVENLSGWIVTELADWDPVLGGEEGKFNGVGKWGEFGGKLNIIGSPKRKPKAAA
jgi:hypothetical protein